MNRTDFVKLIGAQASGAEYLPVAFLLRSGYGCAGHFNAALNEDLSETCVLLNAHLIELRQSGDAPTHRPAIHDFNEFLEEIVVAFYEQGDRDETPREKVVYGKNIPLAAIPFDEIAVIYPVAHIGALMQRATQQQNALPTFLDFRKSEIVALLRTKLW